MTAQQVAEFLGCHPGMIYRIVQRREIPAIRLGSDWRFRRPDIEKWIVDRELRPGGARDEGT